MRVSSVIPSARVAIFLPLIYSSGQSSHLFLSLALRSGQNSHSFLSLNLHSGQQFDGVG